MREMKTLCLCMVGFIAALAVNPSRLRAETAPSYLLEAIKMTQDEAPLRPQKAKKIAHMINFYCESEFKFVSSLSPREGDWLDGEMRTERATSAISSPEMSRRYIRGFADDCIKIANSIKITDKNYLYLFSLLSAHMVDKRDLVWHMKNLNSTGIVNFSKSSIEQADLLVQSTGVSLLRGIVIRGLVP